MHVTVKLFAALRDRAGTGHLDLDVPEGADAAAVMAAAGEATGTTDVLARLPVALAGNRAYADPSAVVRDGDEVALIPPVSGG